MNWPPIVDRPDAPEKLLAVKAHVGGAVNTLGKRYGRPYALAYARALEAQVMYRHCADVLSFTGTLSQGIIGVRTEPDVEAEAIGLVAPSLTPRA